MSLDRSAPERDAGGEIPALIETLIATEARLEALTAGEVDTVAGRDGRTFMLHRAQEQLRLSDAAKQAATLNELQVLFDLMPAMIWFKDTKDRILRVNQRVADVAGKSVAEIEGKPSSENYPQEAARHYEDDLEVIRSGKPMMGIVETIRNRHGEPIWIETDKVPYCDADGKVIGIVVLAQDITERKQAEEALRASEANMATAQRIAHFGSWELEFSPAGAADAQVLRWSDEMFRIAGYEPGAVAVTNELFFRLAHPEDREPIRQALALAICERREYAIVHRLIRPDGQVRVVQEMARIFFDEASGQPLRAVGTAHDITERMQAEARLKGSEAQYRRLFEAAKDGILILNAETGRIEDVNPFLTELLGFTRAEVLQKQVWELGCFQHLIANQEKFSELQRNEYVRYEDLPLETADGQKIAVEFVSNVYEVNGAQVVQCNVRDITERKAAEAAIGRAVQRLNEAQRIGQMGDWEWDVATQAITWSPQVFTIFGRDPSLGPPRNYAEYLALLDAGSRALQTERITQALESGDAPDYDLRMHRPNGEPAVLLGRAMPRKDQTGKVVGLYGTVQDITELKRAEGERTRLTRQMELLLASTDEGINGMDLEGRCNFINRAGAAMLGRKPEEMVGQHLHELIHHHRADGSPYPLADCPLFHAFQKGEGCRVDTEVFWRQDGTSFPVEYSSHPIREAGVITGAVVMFNDITRRKQAEEVLTKRAAELERFHRLSVGRELQMVDLKKEVNALAALAGRAPPYDLSFLVGKTGPPAQP